MIRLLLPFLMLVFINGTAQEKFQLAPPLLKYGSVFFKSQTTLEIKFNQPGTEIRYTLNGNEPTQNDLLYTTPLIIKNNYTIVTAKAMGKDYLTSDKVMVEFFKQGKNLSQVRFTDPNPKYPGNGKTTLNDLKGGLLNFSDGNWLGYNSDSVEIVIDLLKKEKINSVLVNLLRMEGSWIFLPAQIRLYAYDETKKSYWEIGNNETISTKPLPDKSIPLKIIPNRSTKTNKLKLVVYPLKKIPEWHEGKGTASWLFLDEVIVY